MVVDCVTYIFIKSSLIIHCPQPEDKEKVVESWLELLQAFGHLNVTDSELKSILGVLAAIYHLGTAGALKGNKSIQ